MMRPKIVSSLQKTYDECYLTCSTAVFFEGKVWFSLVLSPSYSGGLLLHSEHICIYICYTDTHGMLSR